MPANDWQRERLLIAHPWPRVLAEHDLRYWANSGLPRPSIRKLSETWGWSNSRAGRLVPSAGLSPLPLVTPVTHELLVQRAVLWLRKPMRCPVVFAEITTAACMTPDAIGWRYGSQCILVECKRTRSDFRADAKKMHKRFGATPGHLRFYMTPAGLLRPEQIPADWGLVEVDGKRFSVVVDAPIVQSCFETERAILASAARRFMGDRYDWDAAAARFRRRT